jgi:hypothetical protein
MRELLEEYLLVQVTGYDLRWLWNGWVLSLVGYSEVNLGWS